MLRSAKNFLAIVFAIVTILWLVATAKAAGPRNPYSGFNLSGVNWGSMQWERDQRAGRVVWPYYNAPAQGVGRVSSGKVGASGGGGTGAVNQGEIQRPAQRSYSTRSARRWRR